jgi:hypothetical protein
VSIKANSFKQEPKTALSNSCLSAYKSSLRWYELCELYLPLFSDDSLWRYSRRMTSADIEQGWKLHISATVLTANDVMEKIGSFLQTRKVLFKAPASLLELGKLNSGIYYGYSQIGKFITIYPQTNEEAVRLAQELHKMTDGTAAPLIPFDKQFSPGSPVYYRYGAFKRLEMENRDGIRILAIRNPEGKLIPDLRDSEEAKPAWVSNPFPPRNRESETYAENPLRTTYKVFQALTQRGKGGVYRAVDLSSQPPRLCIIKEGRRDGEVDWNGRDGFWYVKREASVLAALGQLGVPSVYSSFELEGNFYLVTEYIEGESLDKLLIKKKRRLNIGQALEFGIRLSALMTKIHALGWVWRDCKPSNIIVTADGCLRPVDFEGASLIDEPPLSISGTPGFLPPEWDRNFLNRRSVCGDLYALGAVIYYLFTGRLYSAGSSKPLKSLRRNLPAGTQEIIMKLLAANPADRPTAEIVKRALDAELKLTGSRSEVSNKAF